MEKYLKKCSIEDSHTVNVDSESENENEEDDFKRPRNAKSNVWKYFNKSKDGKSAQCRFCTKIYKTSGNTSNLFHHLKRSHPTANDKNFSSSSSKIDSYMVRTYDESSSCKKAIDKALVDLIALDVRPFSIVEDKGFRKFVHALDPLYKLPSRTTLQNVYVMNRFENMKIKLQLMLDNVEHCSITTDGWTSKANDNYLTVTCHFICKDFVFRSVVLSTKQLLNGTNHSAQNISESLREVFENWKIYNKITAIVTDNASSMIKACTPLGKRHLPCFAHSLNLVVQDCLKLDCIRKLIAKCKRIVSYFKSSTIAYTKFKDSQETEKKYSLKQEVPTRWNSSYQMIVRILLTSDAIGKVLLSTSKAPPPLTADEIEILQDLKDLLSPFDEDTVQSSSNIAITISFIIPAVCGLLHNLESLKRNLKTHDGLQVCLFLIERIKTRLLHYEEHTLPQLGTLLDPRFKKAAFSSFLNAAEAEKNVQRELALLSQAIPPVLDIETSEPPTPVEKPGTSTKLFQFLVTNKIKIPKNAVYEISSLRNYFECEHLPEESDVLIYWKSASDQLLKSCAVRVLCVPATSTESERMFSKAGLIISDRRASLKTKHVDMLLFLNKNSWISD